MVDLAKLLHEISVAFAASSNLRTLLPRLATGMSRYCSAVEVEIITLDRDEREAIIRASCPHSGRTWSGTRSSRFLHRQAVEGAVWCSYLEPARLATESIAAQLKIAVGHAGLLTISFSSNIPAELGDQNTEILVDVLRGHCQRLGQLDTLARHTLALHRDSGEDRSPPAEPARPAPQVEPVEDPIEDPVEDDNDISVEQTELFPDDSTGIPVTTIDSALVRCISTALQATQGRIYGEFGAAKLLGVKPSTLQSKMRKLGIERTPFTH